ncbi:hypothetical protein B0H14DRAFT_2572989 [Mycena olivaceomarginata]|nr:hypothetical protein B0H14DRAFT_2572989 [Mycena olivaceomarginata]
MAHSQPSGLTTISFGDVYANGSYPSPDTSPDTVEVLQSSASCLVHLVVDMASPYSYDEGEVLDMFARLPIFMALESLTLWVRPPCKAEGVIDRLKGAPILTTLTFQLVWYNGNEEENSLDFDEIIRALLLWHAADSMKTVLARKFPRLGSWDRVGHLNAGRRPEAGEEEEGQGHRSRGGVRNVLLDGYNSYNSYSGGLMVHWQQSGEDCSNLLAGTLGTSPTLVAIVVVSG